VLSQGLFLSPQKVREALRGLWHFFLGGQLSWSDRLMMLLGQMNIVEYLRISWKKLNMLLEIKLD
jgi:hypothetical protein